MRASLRALVVCTAVAAGCRGNGPAVTGPTASSTAAASAAAAGTPAVPVELQPVLIASGVDNRPVPGAEVLIGDEMFLISDDEGAAHPSNGAYDRATPGSPISVTAPGYLPRRTRIDASRVVTLWPVASDAERNAVHEMVYGRSEVVEPIRRVEYTVVLTSHPEFTADWLAVAGEFSSRFGLSLDVASAAPYEADEIVVTFDDAPSGACAPVGGWGFCRDQAALPAAHVPAERGSDRALIRRVIASAFLGENPLPGLLNPQAPADALSPFEEHTLNMRLLRRRPNRWPDDDQ